MLRMIIGEWLSGKRRKEERRKEERRKEEERIKEERRKEERIEEERIEEEKTKEIVKEIKTITESTVNQELKINYSNSIKIHVNENDYDDVTVHEDIELFNKTFENIQNEIDLFSEKLFNIENIIERIENFSYKNKLVLYAQLIVFCEHEESKVGRFLVDITRLPNRVTNNVLKEDMNKRLKDSRINKILNDILTRIKEIQNLLNKLYFSYFSGGISKHKTKKEKKEKRGKKVE